VNPAEEEPSGKVETWEAMPRFRWVSRACALGCEAKCAAWLLGIPGIDEATALANVISYIESGAYDVIVFDTAPTGHTLKLLNLPKVLQLGLDKLSSWQSKLWSVWQVVKGKGNPQQMQKTVTDRLNQYKVGVEKIAVMLKDTQRTNFVVVCIAEHLSVNETCRLLAELRRNGVGVSHVIVNQLVTQTLQTSEFAALDALLSRCQPSPEEERLLTRARASIQLTNARRNIQQKYIKDLADAPEAKGLKLVEVPLLPTEITGTAALLSFSQRLVPPGFRPGEQAPAELVGWTPHPAPLPMPAAETKEESKVDEQQREQQQDAQPMSDDDPFAVGTHVHIQGLSKAPQYNGLKGTVVSHQPDGRVGVSIVFQGAKKTVSFQRANLVKSQKHEPKTQASSSTSSQTKASNNSSGTSVDPKAALEAKLLADPEVQEALKNPKYKAAFDDLKANPMKIMQYMADPELGPFCNKIMAKMMK